MSWKRLDFLSYFTYRFECTKYDSLESLDEILNDILAKWENFMAQSLVKFLFLYDSRE